MFKNQRRIGIVKGLLILIILIFGITIFKMQLTEFLKLYFA